MKLLSQNPEDGKLFLIPFDLATGPVPCASLPAHPVLNQAHPSNPPNPPSISKPEAPLTKGACYPPNPIALSSVSSHLTNAHLKPSFALTAPFHETGSS